MGKRAVLGFPIQLMYRALVGAVNIGSAIGGTLGKVVTVGASAVTGAITAANVMSSLVPSINNTLNKDSAQNADDLGTRTSPLEALITFFDMNANRVKLKEPRRLAVVDVPGREGDFIQNLGSKSVRYQLTGRFFAVDPKHSPSSPFSPIFRQAFDNNVAVGSTQLLRLLERSGVPAPFMYEYDIAEVIIDNVELDSEGGKPEWINYTIDLIEYRRLPQLAKILSLIGLGQV